MDTHFGRIFEPTIDLGYTVTMVGTPTKDKSVDAYKMVKNVATAEQVKDLCGEESAIYQAYTKAFRKVDVYGQIALNLVLVPTGGDNPTATIQTMTVTGTPTVKGKATLKIMNRTYTYDYQESASAADMLNDLNTHINNDVKCDFKSEVEGTDKLKLTAKVADVYYDDKKPVLVCTTEGFVATVETTNATQTTDLSGLSAFLDKKGVKSKWYLIQDGFVVEPFLEWLGVQQTIDNRDMIGSYAYAKYDTLNNLLEEAEQMNKPYVTLIGYKTGALDYTPFELATLHIALVALVATAGADCSKYLSDSPVGSLSNLSKPLAGCAFTFANITEGFEWTNEEKKLLGKHGVWTGFNNPAGNLAVYRETTTMNKTNEGKEITTYRYLNANECSTAAISYMWQVIDNQFQHKTLDESQVASIRTTLGDCYDELSKPNGDVYVLDARGKEDFTTSLANSMKINYAEGSVTFSKVVDTVLSQLREITAYFSDQFYEEE